MLEDASVCVSIDIGNTSSGYAIAFPRDYKGDQHHICLNQPWMSATSGGPTYKTKTCTLLDASGNLVEFGYAAEEKLQNILYEGEHQNYSYFKNFKDHIYGVGQIKAIV